MDGVILKCPACGQILERIEGVCGEYICINPECLENKKADVQANANYRIALAKK
jgi:hypothetical protein